MINIPTGVVSLFLIYKYIPDYPPVIHTVLDIKGFLLSAIGLASLVFAFESIGHQLFTLSYSIALLILGLLCVFLYIQHSKSYPSLIIDLNLLKIKNFKIAILGGFLFRMGAMGLPFLLVILLQTVFGLDAFRAGLMILLMGWTYLL